VYQDALAARGLVCSMSRSGDCLDNAMAERSFSTRKAELLGPQPWPTRAAARTAVFAWLEIWYNRQRRHSALAYRARAIASKFRSYVCWDDRTAPVRHESGPLGRAACPERG